MTNGDEKKTALTKKQQEERNQFTKLKERAPGPTGRRPPSRHSRPVTEERTSSQSLDTPTKTTVSTATDDLIAKQLEFLKKLHEEIKQKKWQTGKLGGEGSTITNPHKPDFNVQYNGLPHNAARIFILTSDLDSQKERIPSVFEEVSNILKETQHEPLWKKILDKLDFFNLFARSDDTRQFYKKSHDAAAFFKSTPESKDQEAAHKNDDSSPESVKGLPPNK